MQIGTGNDSLTLVAQTEQERGFLREVFKAFCEGSVTIEARKHKPADRCLDCLSSQRYKDCVTASATYNIAAEPIVKLSM